MAEDLAAPPVGSQPQPVLRPRRLKRVLLVLASAVVVLGLPLLIQVGIVRHRETEFHQHVLTLRVQMEASRPAVSEPENAAPLYEAASRLYVGPSGDYAFDAHHGLDSPALLKYLSDNKPYIEAMKRAVARPRCNFPAQVHGLEDIVRASTEDEFDRRYGSMAFLSVAARHAAYSGDSREAVRLYAVFLRAFRDLANSGLNGRMALSVSEGAVAKFMRDFRAGNASEEEMAEAVTRMLGEHLAQRPNMAQAAQEFKLLILPVISSSLSWRNALVGKAVPLRERPGLAWLKLSGTLVDLAWATEAAMDARIAALGKPCSAALDELATLESRDRVRLGAGMLALAQLRASCITGMAAEDAGGLASVHACRLGFGCRLYRLKTGAYPETLAELSAKLPEHFQELPADPFTGKPFLYKRTAAGCLVWSVGKDRADDGGDPKKDIVFELRK